MKNIFNSVLRKKIIKLFILSLFLLTANLPKTYLAQAAASDAVVRAVLFFSPTCPHCHQVMAETIPSLREQYDHQLQILQVDISLPKGKSLFLSAVEKYQIPSEKWIVPMLIVGETVLVGSSEIPAQFSNIIETSLAMGGLDWPDIPGLDEFLTEEVQGQTSSTALIEDIKPISASWTSTVLERFKRDLVGNSLAVVVLIAMLISIIYNGYAFYASDAENKSYSSASSLSRWLLPILLLIGLGIAGYLAFVETTKTEAFCGPVGDCNTVQKSPYAILFGILPVGVLGIIGYIAIGIGWALQNFGPQAWRSISSLIIWGMAIFGVLFALYLTFLEPFVIGATCMWCLANSVIMTLILWVTSRQAIQAWQEWNKAE